MREAGFRVWVGMLGVVGLVAITSTGFARPGSERRPVIQALDPEGPRSDLPEGAALGVFSSAQGGTTWFGGTVWAADSMRWEAIQGQLWTFDSGVGSSIVPPEGPGGLSSPTREWVNPHKAPGIHATLEGWIGFDNTYSVVPYFRRLSAQDSRWTGTVCVGSPGGLGGSYSFWCGVFPQEADLLCYAGGQGYGNSWDVCIEREFSYNGVGGVQLGYAYRNQTEDNFDFAVVSVDTSGEGAEVEVASYTGSVSGTASIQLTQGVELPSAAGSILIRFCVSTDGAWSDQDGLHPTDCGAFAVDNITVSGGGISHSADFELGDGGWALAEPPPGRGEEWASLYHLEDLPPTLTTCSCALYDTVLAFPDDSGGHPIECDNLAASPWIDLRAAGLVHSPGKILRTNLYANLPLLNYIEIQFNVQWYPDVCLSSGKLVTSPWSSGFRFYFPFLTNVCTSTSSQLGTQIDYSALIPPSAEQVRIALGIYNSCRFFSNCTGTSNTSPWFDQVGFGVYGAPAAPFIFADVIDIPQDNFPENGTLNINAPGRVDCNNIQGDSQPEIGTTLGDTLIVGGAVGNAEVYVHFRVTPGPGINPTAFSTWYNSHPNSAVEPGFKVARCDSAERGSTGPLSGLWMTAYHEADPNFSGSDRDLDPTDVAPNGGMWRLANDIFPDDLFTMGTRIDLFYTANDVGSAFYYKTPVGAGVYHEMEILPSSVDAQVEFEWNCVLYVDHFDRGAQGYIEEALTEILGTGSDNFEGTNWDRFDVNAPSTQQMSFGRPLRTEYGASVAHALAYKAILWNTGNLNAFNLTKEDADVLIPWLTLLDFDFNNLYLSGDGIVFSPIFEWESEPSARRLLEDIAGVTLRPSCSQGTFRLANCPVFGEPEDLTACVDLDPVLNARVAGTGQGRSVGHVAQGNGCPDIRSFDVLEKLAPDYGVVEGDERYISPVKAARFASTVTDAASSEILNYKIVVDGISVHYRRDAGTPCEFLQGGRVAVTERLREVLSFFGYAQSTLCTATGAPSGIDDPGAGPASWRTGLVAAHPNPITPGSGCHIRFTMAREGRAQVGIYDLQGRLVRAILDGTIPAGEAEAIWDGYNATGSPVADGVYFVRFQAEGREQSSRLVVLRGGGR